MALSGGSGEPPGPGKRRRYRRAQAAAGVNEPHGQDGGSQLFAQWWTA